ncbi:HET-domain-containing protein [Melanomma pulvis-pyrius CBS 109.77]|uniref:HET-domain-containing protein n=1 Tax=Melanomma pulvis-pyrius CBS 109.77 TaxID=1314802 RepID=A0A6A6WPH3_9PLEO|nr:HET-domain-containing protein [Melanomma pulvis-pyrius CBS 109.77]
MAEPEPDLYGINIAQEWLENCSKHHNLCNKSSLNISGLSEMGSQLPRRLLDIGIAGSKQLRLINTDGMDAENCRYIALSHRWGDTSKMIKTTDSNIKDHLQGVGWEALSKTFQHAIIVTQLLGLRYLWIDSLCIIQNDRNDFHAECARMHIIYLNCYCMISASDAHSGDDGFLEFWDKPNASKPSGTNAKPVVRYRRAFQWSEWSERLCGPLSTRGWAYQERQLAPRILHYTKSGILWECRVCVGVGESSVLLYRKLLHRSRRVSDTYLPPNTETYLRTLDQHLTQSLEETMLQWLDIVEAYSRRDLTFPHDKLPALSGLAATVASLNTQDFTPLAGEYLAGIWEAGLHLQLLWHPDRDFNPDKIENLQSLPDLPSWSWASVAGPVSFSIPHSLGLKFRVTPFLCQKGREFVPMGKFTSPDVVPRGEDRYGQIQSSELIILSEFQDFAELRFHRLHNSSNTNAWDTEVQHLDSAFRVFVIFDTNFPPKPSSMQFRFLHLTKKQNHSTTRSAETSRVGLVLQMAEHGKFRRIGIFYYLNTREPSYIEKGQTTLI